MEGVGCRGGRCRVEGVEAGRETGIEAGIGREEGKLPHFSPLNQISNITY